ncbi:hypothetical protein FXF51_03210 [Nonomuraea sp. PA05]|uniref:sensor histidine kinase n=1 Tax=Nonomuraea sp. PA05 TaxID=2604466 RepID=UPI0011D38E92|nr:histidine kinase [Nonomuraea sp. PA05]TYB70108.1 hypothetical protein FXF51_03210 [Nonomuraea sp. PA05]
MSSQRRDVLLPVLLVCVSLALVLGSVLLVGSDGRWGLYASWGWWTARALALSPCFAVAGALVWWSGRYGLGAVLGVVSISLGVFGLLGLVWYTRHGPGGFLAPGPLALLRGASMLAMHGALAVLPLWFPQGRAAHPRWRWAAGGLAAIYLAYLAPLAWHGWPVTHRDWYSGDMAAEHPWWGLTGHAVIWAPRVLAVAVLIDLLRRRRRAEGLLARQLTMMAAGYAGYWGTQIFDKVIDIGAERDLPQWALFLMNGPLVLSLAVISVAAVLCDGFGVLDRVVRRSLIGLGLVVGLAFAYRGLYLGFTGLLPLEPLPGAALASGLTVLMLRPGAALLWEVADLLLYGRQSRPYELRLLAGSLRDRVPADDVPGLVCRTVVERLGLPAAALTAHTRQGERELARSGTWDDGATVVRTELAYQGDAVGCLTVQLRRGQRALDGRDTAALRVVTDQLGPVVSAIGLREELRISRERVIVAREEERRRLRHDLHDGLGPSLAVMRLQLDTAAGLLGAGSAARELVESVGEQTVRSLGEIRRIIEDLRPPDLDELGLVGALRALVGRFEAPGAARAGEVPAFAVEVPDVLPALPAATETAAYRIAAEALTNVVRHAGATKASLALALEGPYLVLSVTDDGTGPPPAPRPGGVGLTSMVERAEEIGGTCRISARTDGAAGALVLVHLPGA